MDAKTFTVDAEYMNSIPPAIKDVFISAVNDVQQQMQSASDKAGVESALADATEKIKVRLEMIHEKYFGIIVDLFWSIWRMVLPRLN